MTLAVGAAARDWASAPVHPAVQPHVSTHSSGISFRALPPASYSEIEKVRRRRSLHAVQTNSDDCLGLTRVSTDLHRAGVRPLPR